VEWRVAGMATYRWSVTAQVAERPDSKTRNDAVEPEIQELPARWKRICVDAVLVMVVVFCVAELIVRLSHR